MFQKFFLAHSWISWPNIWSHSFYLLIKCQKNMNRLLKNSFSKGSQRFHFLELIKRRGVVVNKTLIKRRGVVVITTAQLHPTNPELRFCADSNPARGVSEIRNCEDLWQWSGLKIRLNAFCRSTIPFLIPQKQFIMLIIIKKDNVQIELDDFPANIYLFIVNNIHTEKSFEMCSKLTIKPPDLP